MPRGLSDLQRSILLRVAEATEWARPRMTDVALRCLEAQGVSLAWVRRGMDKTPAGRAAFSRALKRLERRGLALRANRTSGLPEGPRKGYVRETVDEPHRRTDVVKLTPAGLETVNSHRGRCLLTDSTG